MNKVSYRKSLAFCNPKLAEEWHPWKNGLLTPNDVTESLGKKYGGCVQIVDMSGDKAFINVVVLVLDVLIV